MLEPIPIPRGERWRAFATETLPVLLFGSGVVVAAVLWRHSGIAPTLIAEAESIQAEVKSLRPGIVTGLDLAPLQTVAAGTTIGFVQTAEPENAAASLALIRAELDLLQATQAPTLDPARIALERRRLELDWMRERVTLASLRGQLQQAEADLARLRPLHERRLVSLESYDSARTLRERLATQLHAQEELVSRLKPTLFEQSHGTDGEGAESPPILDALAAGIKAQEQKLRVVESQFAPMALIAPIDGIVLSLLRRNGEAAIAGEPIVVLGATRPTRLIGFLRQPLGAKPAVGSPVEVRTRGAPRDVAAASLLEVSSVLEPVPPTLLAVFNRVGTPERGLRVQLSVPPSLDLRPGEIVDVAIASAP